MDEFKSECQSVRNEEGLKDGILKNSLIFSFHTLPSISIFDIDSPDLQPFDFQFDSLEFDFHL